jgi:hypothetical protein
MRSWVLQLQFPPTEGPTWSSCEITCAPLTLATQFPSNFSNPPVFSKV